MVEGYKKCDLGNDLEFTDDVLNQMLLILREYGSDDFWKLLKYNKKDALTNPTYFVSDEEKYEMTKQDNVDGEGNEITRIKVVKFNEDISVEAHNEIRIFDASWTIPDTNQYNTAIGLEVISHNSLIVLTNGKRSINVLRHELYKIFNNAYVHKSVGKMTNVGIRGNITLFNKDYQGYSFGLISRSS